MIDWRIISIGVALFGISIAICQRSPKYSIIASFLAFISFFMMLAELKNWNDSNMKERLIIGSLTLAAFLVLSLCCCQIWDFNKTNQDNGFEISFEVNKSIITRGERVLLSWNTSNFNHVVINPGEREVNKSGAIIVSPDKSTDYKLTATNQAGYSINRTVEVIIKPSIDNFYALDNKVNPDEAFVLIWNVSNADNVTIEGIGTVGPNGRKKLSAKQTTSYKLIAASAKAGNVSETIDVTVIEKPEINWFKADPNNIDPGENCTLSWSVSHAEKIKIDHGIGAVESVNTTSVSPYESTEYKLTATNEIGYEKTEKCKVTVSQFIDITDDKWIDDSINWTQANISVDKKNKARKIEYNNLSKVNYARIKKNNEIDLSELKEIKFRYQLEENHNFEGRIEFHLKTKEGTVFIVNKEVNQVNNGPDEFSADFHDFSQGWCEDGTQYLTDQKCDSNLTGQELISSELKKVEWIRLAIATESNIPSNGSIIINNIYVIKA